MCVYASSDALEADTSLVALKHNALSSAAYYGGFSHIFTNPASLPLLSDKSDYQVTYALSESYDTTLWGHESVSYMQNLTSELQGTVVSAPVALSAKISSALDNRSLREDGCAYYDMYSSFDLELALGYSFFNHFSIGARLGGGNSSVRLAKRMTGIIDAAGNAWFSPYEQMSGSERFNVNIGTLFYYDNYSIGLVFDDLLSSSLDSRFAGSLLSNTTFALSYRGDVYDAEGNLRYLVPRVGVDFRGVGFTEGERSISASGDLTLQFLKDVFLDIAAKYSYMVAEDRSTSSAFALTVNGAYGDFSLLINVVFLQNVRESFRPSVLITYST